MSNLSCVYLNLDEAAGRRDTMEAALKVAASGVSFERIRAIPAEEAELTAGALSGPLKGCFLSHRLAIQEAANSGASAVYVLEDDAEICTATFKILPSILSASAGWDVIFTDVGFWEPNDIVQLTRMRRDLAGAGLVRLLDLRPFQFFGASAYVVTNPGKISRLLAEAELNLPYDLYLRKLVVEGQIRAATCFPFLSAVTSAAEQSQLSGTDRTYFDLAVNTFRRLMYVGRDFDSCRSAANRLVEGADPEDRVIGAICAAIASKQFSLDQ